MPHQIGACQIKMILLLTDPRQSDISTRKSFTFLEIVWDFWVSSRVH
jgi:hypothetical protein